MEEQTDKEFFTWIYNRMIHVYGESENVDYMIKFKALIEKYGFIEELGKFKNPFMNPK